MLEKENFKALFLILNDTKIKLADHLFINIQISDGSGYQEEAESDIQITGLKKKE